MTHRVLVTCLTFAILACNDAATGPGSTAPHSIVIAMEVDGHQSSVGWWEYPAQLTATVHDRSGRVIPGASVTWSSDDPSRGTVDANGVVTFHNFFYGTSVNIRARSGNATAVLLLPVILGLDSLRIWPRGSVGMTPSGTRPIVALRYLSNGDIGGPHEVVWGSTDSGLVSLAGADNAVERLLTAGPSTGSALITASAGWRADTIEAAVERPITDQIAMGFMGTCIVSLSDGRPWCWGGWLMGLYSIHLFNPSFAAPLRGHAPDGISDLALGWRHGCAVTTSGALECWNDDGVHPAVVPASAGPWRDVTVGSGNGEPVYCAVSVAGALWCWGDYQGARFTGPTPDPVPHAIRPDLSFRAVEVVTTPPSIHFCAIDTANAVWCWGKNQHAQTGQPASVEGPPLARVQGLPSIRAVSLGTHHTCALDFDGEVWCWGNNRFSQLGRVPEGPDSHVPERIEPLSNVVAIAAGGHFTCALDALGVVWCWGFNGSGQLGLGDRIDRVQPTPVPRLIAKRIAASGELTCALRVGAGVSCWGREPNQNDVLTPQEGNPDIRTAP